MENRQILKVLVVLILLCLPLAACATMPTALVVDAESGKPVEGAIALAQWFETVPLGLGLGATQRLDKAAEAYSDKDGKVNIDGFWGVYVFSQEPRLTVYKPGYVIWDSKEICPIYEKRTDFDDKHRTVKLLKFDTEAVRWLKEGYDKGRGGPRQMQDLFFGSCYSGEMGTKYNGQIKFQSIFDKYEVPLIRQEELQRRLREKSK